MLPLRRWHILLLSVALLVSPAWAARSHRSATAHRHRRYHHRYHHRYARHHYVRGQRAMTPDRVRQIQAALIQKHYLKGKPDGRWDAKTQDAMRSFQSDHGWQTKLLPDARALIALGLGPKTDENQLKQKKAIHQPKPSIDYADTLAAVQIVSK